MATNLSIDPALIDRALAVSGERTKKATVTKALQEFVARREQKQLLELFRKLEWDSGYDYKGSRRNNFTFLGVEAPVCQGVRSANMPTGM